MVNDKMKSKSQKGDDRHDPDAVSLHTAPDDAQYTDDFVQGPEDASSSSCAPPNYEETTAYHDPDHGKFQFTGLSVRERDFESTSQRLGKTTIAGEHVRIQQARADTDPEYLQKWVEYMSRQTPNPYIVVTGTHWEEQYDSHEKKKKRVSVTDFQICVSMKNYLWPNFRKNDPSLMELRTVDNGEKTWRGTVLKKRAPGSKGDIEVGDDKPTLQEWCHRYCASSSKTRIFRLTREVTGLDKERIRTRLTGIIRAARYKGHLDVSFPVAGRAVDVYSTSLLNNWRLTTLVCWVFYLTFLWIFSWPILYLSTKRYNIVKAEWPFSQVDSLGNRRYTTVSEEQWIEKYGPAIKQLAWDRYVGVAGDDQLNHVLARPETHCPIPAEFRGAQAALGAAVGASRGGPNFANQVGNVLRFAGGSNDEIGWGYDT